MKMQLEDGKEVEFDKDSIGYYCDDCEESDLYPNIKYNIDPIAIVKDKKLGFFYIGNKDLVFTDLVATTVADKGKLIFDPEQVTKVVLVSKVVSFTELHKWETKA